jgi:hypothetical protein
VSDPNLDNPAGLLEPGNIDFRHLPVFRYANNVYSTVRSKSFDFDGQEVLLPTIGPQGQVLTDEQVKEEYRRTHKHLGIFASPEAANVYATALHNEEAKRLGMGGTTSTGLPAAAPEPSIPWPAPRSPGEAVSRSGATGTITVPPGIQTIDPFLEALGLEPSPMYQRKYGVPKTGMDKQESLFRAIAASPNPNQVIDKINTSAYLADTFHIDQGSALANIDAVSQAWMGKIVPPRNLFQNLRAAWTTGELNLEIGFQGTLLSKAPGGHDPLIEKRIQELEAKMPVMDELPKPWLQDILMSAAQAAPAMIAMIAQGKTLGTLVGGASAALMVATATATGGLSIPAIAAAMSSVGFVVGSTQSSVDYMQGLAYLDMRKKLVPHSIALPLATFSGVLQSVLQMTMVASAVGNIPGIRQAVTEATNAAVTKIITSGVLTVVGARIASRVAGGAGLQGVDMGLREMATITTEQVAKELSANQGVSTQIDPVTWNGFWDRVGAATLNGFKVGLVFSTAMAPLPRNIRGDIEAVQKRSDLHEAARIFGNKEQYVAAVEAATVRPPGMTAAGYRDAAGGIWDQETTARTEQMAAPPVVKPTGQYRTPSGQMYTQDRVMSVTPEGTTTRMTAGHPGTKEAYGYVDFTRTAEGIYIGNVVNAEGIDNTREMILTVVARNPGAPIEWGASGPEETAIRERLIADNPSGPENGLQWFPKVEVPPVPGVPPVSPPYERPPMAVPVLSPTEALTHDSFLQKFQKEFNLSDEEVGFFARMDVALSAVAGKPVNDWLSGFISPEVISPSLREDLYKAGGWAASGYQVGGIDIGYGEVDAPEYAGRVRAVFAAMQSADLHSAVHEYFHAVERLALTPEQRTLFEKALDPTALFGKPRASWNESDMETLAGMFENFLGTGETPVAELKPVFLQMAAGLVATVRWASDPHRALVLSPAFVQGFDALFANPESGLTQGAAAAEGKAPEPTVQEEARRSVLPERAPLQIPFTPTVEAPATEAQYIPGTSEAPKTFDQYVAEQQAEVASLGTRVDAVVRLIGNHRSSQFEIPGQSGYIIIHPSTMRNAFTLPWQATFFGGPNDPWGHSEYSTLREAVSNTIRDGHELVQIEKRVERAPGTMTTILDPNFSPETAVPLNQILTSAEVPQFKEKMTPLESKEWAKVGVAPITLWRRLNGNLEIITGRHRLDLARRLGMATIPSQIVEESQGFTAAHAVIFDAESNIRDGMGSTRDFAQYFRGTGYTEAEARSRELLRSDKAVQGFAIGKYASDGLYDLWRNTDTWKALGLNEGKIVALASAAPNDPAMQEIGIRAAKEMTIEGLNAYLTIVKQTVATLGSTQLDFFGRDTPQEVEAKIVAKEAVKLIGELRDERNALQGAVRLTAPQREAVVGPYGFNPGDTAGMQERIVALDDQILAWSGDGWGTDPAKHRQLRARAGLQHDAIPLFHPRDEDRANRFIERLVTHFGVTEDAKEAGYILPDGRMLNFSGGAKGTRTIEHEAIHEAVPEWYAGDAATGSNGLEIITNAMLDTGIVRIDALWGVMQSVARPTDAQLGTMAKVFEVVNGPRPGYSNFSLAERYKFWVEVGNERGWQEASAPLNYPTVQKLRDYFDTLSMYASNVPPSADNANMLFHIDESSGVQTDPAKITEDDVLLLSDYMRKITGAYRGGINSTTTPVEDLNLKLGQWRVDDHRYYTDAHPMAQLQKLDPQQLVRTEDLVETNAQGRGEDAVRYQQWLTQGLTPPPIEVSQRADGSMVITDGHRRHMAALQAGQPIFAWVSARVVAPEQAQELRWADRFTTFERSTGREWRGRVSRLLHDIVDENDQWMLKSLNVIEAKMKGPMNVSDLRKLLTNEGVKTDELKWTGMEELLTQTGKITPEEVRQYILANVPKLEEVKYGAGSMDAALVEARKTQEAAQDRYADARNVAEAALKAGGLGGFLGARTLRRLVNPGAYPTTEVDEAWQQALVTAPTIDWGALAGARAQMEWQNNNFEALSRASSLAREPRYLQWNLTGGKNHTEILLTLPQDPNSPTAAYRSGHWSGVDNPVVHARTTERTTAEGKRMLFVEEIQSDWHQAGRERGYIGRQYAEQSAVAARALEAQRMVPEAPFSKTWHELAFRRMVRYAADKGFEEVGWTTGEQQNKRYNLATQVKEISVFPIRMAGDRLGVTSGWRLRALSAEGNFNAITEDVSTLSDLDAYIGREVADKVRERVARTGKALLTGLDLEVGGAGMKGFYDKMLVDYANKFGKKWGVQVGKSELQAPKLQPDLFESGVTVHSLPLTPEMIAEVQQGQYLFHKADQDELNKLSSGWYGTTEDPREAGYMLSDGRMLNFSGEHWVFGTPESGKYKGTRSVDHDDVARFINGGAASRFRAKYDFMARSRAIRMEYIGGSMEVTGTPSEAQFKALGEMMRSWKIAELSGTGDNLKRTMKPIAAMYLDIVSATSPYNAVASGSIRPVTEAKFRAAFDDPEMLRHPAEETAAEDTFQSLPGATRADELLWEARQYGTVAEFRKAVETSWENGPTAEEKMTPEQTTAWYQAIWDQAHVPRPKDAEQANSEFIALLRKSGYTVLNSWLREIRKGNTPRTSLWTAEEPQQLITAAQRTNLSGQTKRGFLQALLARIGQDPTTYRKLYAEMMDDAAMQAQLASETPAPGAELNPIPGVPTETAFVDTLDLAQVLTNARLADKVVQGSATEAEIATEQQKVLGEISQLRKDAASKLTDKAMADVTLALRNKQREQDALRKLRAYRQGLGEKLAAPVSKGIDFNYAEMIRQLVKGVLPETFGQKRQYARDQSRAFFEENPEAVGALPKETWDRLQKKSIDEWTTEDLEDMLVARKQMEKMGRMMRSAKLAKRERILTQMRATAVTTVLRGKAPEVPVGAAPTTPMLRTLFWATLKPDRMMTMLDNDTTGVFTSFLDDYNAHWNDMKKITGQRQNAIYKVMADLKFTADPLDIRRTQGFTWVGAPMDVDGFEYSMGKWKPTQPKPTIEDVMFWYIGSRNERTMRHLTLGNNIPEAVIRRGIELLSPEAKQLADAISGDFEKSFVRLRQAFIDTFNMDLPGEDFYVPNRVRQQNYQERAEAVAADLIARNGLGKQFVNRNPTFTRVDIPDFWQTPIKTNLMGVWLENIDQTEGFIHLDRPIKNMHSVLEYPTVRRALTQQYGVGMNNWLSQFTNALAKPDLYGVLTHIDRFQRMMRKNVVVAYLAFNFLSVAKNLVTVLPYLADAGIPHLVGAAGQFLNGKLTAMKEGRPLGNTLMDFVYSKSELVRNRSISEEFELMKRSDPNLYAQIQGKFGQWGMKLFEIVDITSISIGWKAVYDRVIAEKGTDAEACLAADKSTIRGQPSGRVQDMAAMYRSADAFRWFTMFTNALNSLWNIAAKDVPVAFKNHKIAHAAGDITSLCLAGVAIAIASGAFDSPDPEERKKRLAAGIWTQFTGMIPIIGGNLTSLLQGRPATGVQFMPSFQSVATAIGSVKKGDPTATVANFLEAIGYTVGAPSVAFKRLLKGLETGDPGDFMGWK